jgi:hypothetical protein
VIVAHVPYFTAVQLFSKQYGSHRLSTSYLLFS